MKWCLLKSLSLTAGLFGSMIWGAQDEAQAATQDSAAECPAYAVEGENGPDVLLLPGLNSSPAVWDGFVASAKAGYRLHRVSVPGFAGAPADAAYADKPADALVADISRYIACNDLQDVTIAGHSFGGFTSLKMALSGNSAIARVIVVDAMPFYPLIFDPVATVENTRTAAQGFVSMITSQSGEQFAASQAQAMRSLVQGGEDQARVLQWSLDSDRNTMAAVVGQLMGEDLRAGLKDISVPVTVIYATNVYAPAARLTPIYEGAYAGLTNGQLTQVGNSFHFIMYDQPDAFAAAMMAALKRE